MLRAVDGYSCPTFSSSWTLMAGSRVHPDQTPFLPIPLAFVRWQLAQGLSLMSISSLTPASHLAWADTLHFQGQPQNNASTFAHRRSCSMQESEDRVGEPGPQVASRTTPPLVLSNYTLTFQHPQSLGRDTDSQHCSYQDRKTTTSGCFAEEKQE